MSKSVSSVVPPPISVPGISLTPSDSIKETNIEVGSSSKDLDRKIDSSLLGREKQSSDSDSNPPSKVDFRDQAKKTWENFRDTNLFGEKLSFVQPIIKEGKKLCVINPEDVLTEESTWNSSVICAVFGSEPPLQVFDGFIRRIWADFGVEKIVKLDNSQFIVKFQETTARDKVVEHGIWFFDRKPLVVHPWSGDMDALKGIKIVPVWVKFPSLPMRYWNERSLSAIWSLIGMPIMTDKFTKERSFLNIARVLIEMEIDIDLIQEVQFINGYGQVATQTLDYDWKPVLCKNCHNMGHLEAECKHKTKKVWQVKTMPPHQNEPPKEPAPIQTEQQTQLPLVVVKEKAIETNDRSGSVISAPVETPWLTPRTKKSRGNKAVSILEMDKCKSIINAGFPSVECSRLK